MIVIDLIENDKTSYFPPSTNPQMKISTPFLTTTTHHTLPSPSYPPASCHNNIIINPKNITNTKETLSITSKTTTNAYRRLVLAPPVCFSSPSRAPITPPTETAQRPHSAPPNNPARALPSLHNPHKTNKPTTKHHTNHHPRDTRASHNKTWPHQNLGLLCPSDNIMIHSPKHFISPAVLTPRTSRCWRNGSPPAKLVSPIPPKRSTTPSVWPCTNLGTLGCMATAPHALVGCN